MSNTTPHLRKAAHNCQKPQMLPSSDPHTVMAVPPTTSPTRPSAPPPLPGLAPSSLPPLTASGAIYVGSVPIPKEWSSREVKGIDFNDFAGRDVTATDLIRGMAKIGFQASNVTKACELIDEMVNTPLLFFFVSRSSQKYQVKKKIMSVTKINIRNIT